MEAKDAQSHKRSRDRDDDDGNGCKNDGHDGDNDEIMTTAASEI